MRRIARDKHHVARSDVPDFVANTKLRLSIDYDDDFIVIRLCVYGPSGLATRGDVRSQKFAIADEHALYRILRSRRIHLQ